MFEYVVFDDQSVRVVILIAKVRTNIDFYKEISVKLWSLKLLTNKIFVSKIQILT